MERALVAAIALALVVTAGCVAPLGGTTPHEPGHLSAIEVPDGSPARAAPITDEELDRAPELERVLTAAREDANGTASLTVEPRHVDRVTTVLAGKPVYGPDSPLFHRDGVYVRYDGTVVLIETPDDVATIYAIPSEVTLRSVPVNDVEDAAWADHSEFRALVDEAVSTGDVARRPRNETPDATLAFLDALEAYRPRYNDHEYWGATVRYRGRRYAVSMWQNDTAG